MKWNFIHRISYPDSFIERCLFWIVVLSGLWVLLVIIGYSLKMIGA